MTTKAEYLKKYLDSNGDKKKKKRIKKRSNLAVHDDDIDWRSLQPVQNDHSDKDENDLDEAPLVAEFKDDSVRKWQPVSNIESKDEHSIRSKSGQRKVRMDSPDMSPRRRNELSDVDDLSPPRQRRSVSSDLSPPRQRRSVSPDLSPPRRGMKAQNVRDSKRGPRTSSRGQKRRPPSPDVISSRLGSKDLNTDGLLADHSPPKRRNRRDSSDDDSFNVTRHSQTQGTTIRMASGKKTDSRNAEELKLDMNSAKNKQEAYYQKTGVVSGQHTETVYRDKEGRRIDPKLEKIKKEQAEKMMHEENEKFTSWGRGTAQTKSAKEKLEDDLYEMSKPLARYADDEDLERLLKEREREGDPMLAFIKKKTKKIQSSLTEKPKKEKPSYKGSAPPNRFGIRPGYRWDGVDRSNGFEKAWFSRESNKKAFDEEAYKWSVEDM